LECRWTLVTGELKFVPRGNKADQKKGWAEAHPFAEGT
jgi:hypothetical protein